MFIIEKYFVIPLVGRADAYLILVTLSLPRLF